MSRFAVDIERFQVKTREQLIFVLRRIALELFQKIVDRTPVDTGRARGNWQVEVGSVNGNVLDRFDPNGADTIQEGQSRIMSWKGDSAIFLFNNVPYIMALEEGWSDQTPNGMVRVTVQEYPGIVETEARK